MRALLLAFWVFTSPALAQGASQDLSGDARFLTLSYGAREIIQLPTSPDMVQTVLFGQGEIIRSVTLSDPSAYLVSVSGKGDSMTLRPNGVAALAIMSVRTDLRNYEIQLTTGLGGDAPAVVRFVRREEPRPASGHLEEMRQARGFVYRLSGNAALHPSSIRDDGSKMYLVWKGDQPMPAVFGIGVTGAEEMVDGYMRGGFFTIDHVYERLVFRLDRKRAAARRIKKRDGDGRD